MQSQLLSALGAQHAQIRERWTALLHVEPVSTPLANPDALVHLIDWSLEELFRSLESLASRRRTRQAETKDAKPHCPCGRNPLLTYFSAGQQALQEALILAQVSAASLEPLERDASLIELNLVLTQLARREIEAFCGVCQHHHDGSAARAAPTPERSLAGVQAFHDARYDAPSSASKRWRNASTS